ncbi:MAG: arylsulfatase A family protein, partial [Verrucomicrobia bacterium]|nr:arylsulfatase A family protein [Verrucomicrobiota bacterium]
AEELYLVESDPFEKSNLADDPGYQDVLVEMRAMIRQRMKEVGDDKSLSGEPRFLKDYPLP